MARANFYILTNLGRKIPVYTSGIPDSTNFSVSNPVEVNVSSFGGTRVKNNIVAISFTSLNYLYNYIEAVASAGAEYLLPNENSGDPCFVAFSSSPIPDPLISVNNYPTKGIYGCLTTRISGIVVQGTGFQEGSPLLLENLYIGAYSDGSASLTSANGDGSGKIIYHGLSTIGGQAVSAGNIKSLFVTEEIKSNIILKPTAQYISKGGTIQFNLIAEYDDGSTEDVTNYSKWRIFQNSEDDVVQSLDGYTITDTGLLTAVNPTYPSILIEAEYNNIKTLGAAYLTDFPGIYNSGGVMSGSIGGKGEFGKNEVSDLIDVPSGSVAGDASSTGMFTRYLANSSYLDTFGEWLWTTDFGLHVARTVISLIYGNPADSVISVMSYPFDIKTLSGVTSKQQNLVWGNFDSGISFNALTSSSATIDWGTISLEEYWGNFLDYEPHTKIELYLPWGTGFVSIDPGQCLPGTLKVITNIDLSKGSCIHSVIGNNGCVIGTYAGQCSQQIPILSNDYASKVAGVVVGATALAVAGTAGGGAVSAGNQAAIDYGASHSMPFGDASGMAQYRSGLESAIASAESPYLSTQRTAGKLAAASSLAALRRSGIVARNGSFTDGSAALGVQYPYIILSRPTQSVPEEYGHHYGYPSNIYVKLGNLRGYTEVGEIHLDGISATESEIAELDSILKGGVIF